MKAAHERHEAGEERQESRDGVFLTFYGKKLQGLSDVLVGAKWLAC